MSSVPGLLELDHVPDGLLERPASALYQQLEGPTLIHLEGRIKRPLFVTVLQHGNEITGWEAVRRILKNDYQKIQNLALEEIKQKYVDEWVNTKVESTYIKIDDEYKDCEYRFKGWIK